MTATHQVKPRGDIFQHVDTAAKESEDVIRKSEGILRDSETSVQHNEILLRAARQAREENNLREWGSNEDAIDHE
eukprot:15466265-Alexandrium_andersonii.AAC.1